MVIIQRWYYSPANKLCDRRKIATHSTRASNELATKQRILLINHWRSSVACLQHAYKHRVHMVHMVHMFIVFAANLSGYLDIIHICLNLAWILNGDIYVEISTVIYIRQFFLSSFPMNKYAICNVRTQCMTKDGHFCSQNVSLFRQNGYPAQPMNTACFFA